MSRFRLGILSLAALAALLLPGTRGARGGGVLVPAYSGGDPDPGVLAMQSMRVRVAIDGLHAQVSVEQIWENRTDAPLEGRYEFPLGPRAVVQAFSIWEGSQRLHGVVIEKRHGRRLYQELGAQQIDPGLAETGDDGDEHVFAVRVTPIPAHGTTRVLLTYEQPLALSSLAAQLVVPLGPRRAAPQPVAELSIEIDVKSPLAMPAARVLPAAWFAQQPAADTRAFTAAYTANKLELANDLVIDLAYAVPAGGFLGELHAYRDPSPLRDRTPFAPGADVVPDDAGFFMARAIWAPTAAHDAPPPPRDIVFVLDTSLSMQWDKLDTAFAALEYGLGQRLRAGDEFGVIMFNDQVRAWRPSLEPATGKHVAAALDFVRAGHVAGGTDLAAAITAAADLLHKGPRAGAQPLIVLITDGRPTWGEIGQQPLEQAIAAQIARVPGARLFVLGIGEDDDDLLLAALPGPSGGGYAHLASYGGDGADREREVLFDQLDGRVHQQLSLALPPGAKVEQVYGPPQAWAGGDALFFGRYRVPIGAGKATLSARDADGTTPSWTFPIDLPAADTARPWIARGWAMRRVHDLLDRIRLDGERADWIAEIISLGKRFMLVTPYTSFIAAPRALLRPRNFQAGDPLLRVKTGPEIAHVVAIFPWGLEKSLEYVADEELWETRFLAPSWMKDGSYRCTLVLTDRDGRKLREDKRFHVDSTPPVVTVALAHGAVRPGEPLEVRVQADQDTRQIRARLDDGAEVDIRWSATDKRSIGTIIVPTDTPPGTHHVTVVAEDFARNTTLASVDVAILPAVGGGQ